MSITVGELKRIIESLPDSAIVVTSVEDHQYRPASVFAGSALYDARGLTWCEDYGEDTTPEKEYGKRLPVLIVR